MLSLIACLLLADLHANGGLAEQLIAAEDANRARYTAGKLVYSIETTSLDGRAAPQTEKLTLQFSGDNYRWSSEKQRGYVHGDKAVTCLNYGSRISPPDHVVKIEGNRRRDLMPYAFLHPRFFGYSVESLGEENALGTSVSSLIRSARDNKSLEVRIKQQEASNQVLCEVLDTSSGNPLLVESLQLDPATGFRITMQETLSRKVAGKPLVRRILYQRDEASGDVFVREMVVEQSKPVKNATGGMNYVPSTRVTYRLIDAGTGEGSVEPSVFTVDGLELPKGAYIEDQTTGKTYLYGIPAINEKELDKQITQLILDHQAATAPKHSLPWLWFAIGGGAFVAVLGLIIAAGYLRRKRLAAA